MIVVLGIHLAIALVCVAAGPRLGRRTFLLAATAPAAGAVWLASVAGGVLDGTVEESTLTWVPDLDLAMTLRLDGFGLLMASLVTVIGTAVFVWAASYFGDRDDAGRITATLVVFAGSMLGLVTADDLLALYVFWELTTVTSYLLIGTDDRSASARAAALRALLVTAAGGLVMLGGIVLLGIEAGSTSLSAITASPPSGTATSVAVALVVVGALTKSAQWPFSFWLPGAMAAPTPISAYLHSATMVKAGVYLLARLSPAFAEIGWWRPLVMGLGLITMLAGGWRALRQHDLKLLMAQSTVSQLGFMVVLVGSGEEALIHAGMTLVLAHALYKSALFLVVGIVDHQAHTRDMRKLDGLGRAMPVVALAAVASGASMAGIPPLLGFVAKEGAYQSLVDAGGTYLLVLAGVVAGSVLTFAYTARFLWGGFAHRGLGGRAGRGRLGRRDEVVDASTVQRPPAPLVGPVLVLTAASVTFGLVPALVDGIVAAASDAATGHEGHLHLSLWHGATPALGLSVLTIALGALAFLARDGVERVADRIPHPPLGERAYAAVLSGMNRWSERVTGVVQSGSLPIYLSVILLSLAVLPLTVVLDGAKWPEVALAESPLQAIVVAVMLVGAVMVAITRHRITAALCLGIVGAGMSALFVVQGAPDLATTQLLVEVLSLVLFVLVLRLLPTRYAPSGTRISQAARVAVAVTVAVAVFTFALVTSGARTAPSVSEDHLELALPEGEGSNVVNVTLVDIRGWDTLGEITVLLVAAVGIAGLVIAGRPGGRRGGSAATGGPGVAGRAGDVPKAVRSDAEPAEGGAV